MTTVAIIGDRFMGSSVFEREILASCGDRVTCKCIDLAWPDEPMEHGYATPGLEGLKEYMGTPEMVLDHLQDAQVLVTHLAPVSVGVLEAAPNLKLVGVSRGGPVNIAMDEARERGVLVVNTPGRNASAVAEFTIGAIIAETRNITKGHDSLRRGDYRGDLYRADIVGNELSDMCIGVIGYGNVGTRVVKLLRAFGSKILVTDPYVQLSVEDSQDGVEQVALDRLLSESDVVTLHPRVTKETTGMIGKEQFAAMKPGAVVINTARGPLMDYQALFEALSSGQLGGAMLETFAVEPTDPNDPLLQLPNVTLTPHIAGASQKTVKIAAQRIAEEIRRWISDEPPLSPC
ncbi:2-hydroxyacid dehydrogenase [Roseibium porphyridii]|uniref:2-hydroxyacid dehydrogenase n=1 Tax=Roseibium porphyridii TaxID=2866279 RepID=A0ABY8F525_9HYPH|nr:MULTISPECIES: 2-hydroxyacid dehydrogenase [Stappiaceae]QFT29911.1 Putative 2-hydroxyacid dehydrogenase YoaD [Labrenzia sp. THAF82]WFE90593.1 2-hydroxyacid dehydrogenase [Roseibium sp. KMA01]